MYICYIAPKTFYTSLQMVIIASKLKKFKIMISCMSKAYCDSLIILITFFTNSSALSKSSFLALPRISTIGSINFH